MQTYKNFSFNAYTKSQYTAIPPHLVQCTLTHEVHAELCQVKKAAKETKNLNVKSVGHALRIVYAEERERKKRRETPAIYRKKDTQNRSEIDRSQKE